MATQGQVAMLGQLMDSWTVVPSPQVAAPDRISAWVFSGLCCSSCLAGLKGPKAHTGTLVVCTRGRTHATAPTSPHRTLPTLYGRAGPLALRCARITSKAYQGTGPCLPLGF